MAEITSSVFCAFGVPFELMADLSNSALGQAGPRSLGAVKQEDAGGRVPYLDLVSSGEQTAGTLLNLKTTRGGSIGGAGGIWKRSTDASDEYRGLDAPDVMTGFQPITWSTAGQWRTPSAVTLADGSQVVAHAYKSVATWAVTVRVYDAAADTYGSQTTLASGLDGSFLPWPWLLQLTDGRLLCFYWVVADGLANIDVQVSPDGGTTWSTYATSILQQALVAADGNNTPNRITVALSGGEMALCFHATDAAAGTAAESIWHWFSADLGSTFTYLGARSDVAYPVLLTHQGLMYLSYLYWTGTGSTKVYLQTIVPHTLFDTTAATDISTAVGGLAVGNVSGSPRTLSNGDLAMAAEGGLIWIWALNIDSGLRHGYAAYYNILTATAASGLRAWWYDGQATSTEWPKEFHAQFWRRQVRIYGTSESGSATYESKLARWDLGGWSSWNMPFPDLAPLNAQRVTWDLHYVPMQRPSSVGWTFAGAGTQDVTTTPGWVRNNTAAAQAYDSKTRSVGTGYGGIWWFRVRVVSGGSISSTAIGIILEVANVAQKYRVAVQFSSTQIRTRDVHGATDLATISMGTTGSVDVIVAINFGAVTAIARQTGQQQDRLWTVISDGDTLTDGGAGGSDVVQFGNISSATAISEWQIVAGVDDTLLDAGSVVASGLDNPDSLRPGTYLTVPGWVGEGVSIGARGGPGSGGDAYIAYPDATYAQRFAVVRGSPDQAEYVRGGMRPGPTQEWRSLDTADVTFPAYARWTFTDAATRLLPPVVIVHFEGLNTESVLVRRHIAGGASQNIAVHDQTVNTTGLKFTRTGAILTVDTGSASTTEPWTDPDEWAGGYVVEGGALYPILHNGPGRWSNDGDAQLPWIEVGGSYASISSSGTMKVIPPRSTLVYFNVAGDTAAGFELYYSSAPTTYEGYVKGTIAFCAGEALGTGPDWGESRDEAPVAENRRSRWGVDFLRQSRTPRRLRTLPWTWRATDAALRGGSSAGTRLYFRASSTGGAPIIACTVDDARKLGGIWRQAAGGAVPLVWMPRLARGTPNTISIAGLDVGFLGLLNNTPRFTRASGYDVGGVRTMDEEGTEWVLEELR